MATGHQEPVEGGCLCGAVRYRVFAPFKDVMHCHCTMCRTWGGGPLLSLRLAADAEIEGEEHVARYASSEWAERGFCRNCGTHLFFFYRPKRSYSFTAGLFDGADGFAFVEEIFVDEKPAYYDFAGERDRLTRAEVIEKFSPGGTG